MLGVIALVARATDRGCLWPGCGSAAAGLVVQSCCPPPTPRRSHYRCYHLIIVSAHCCLTALLTRLASRRCCCHRIVVTSMPIHCISTLLPVLCVSPLSHARGRTSITMSIKTLRPREPRRSGARAYRLAPTCGPPIPATRILPGQGRVEPTYRAISLFPSSPSVFCRHRVASR